MSELIEKQTIIDWLKYKWNRSTDSLFYGIQGLPSVNIESKWIPCDKEIPSIPIRVQVQVINGWIITAYYENDRWYTVPYSNDSFCVNNIIAWRPLPEPYLKE